MHPDSVPTDACSCLCHCSTETPPVHGGVHANELDELQTDDLSATIQDPCAPKARQSDSHQYASCAPEISSSSFCGFLVCVCVCKDLLMAFWIHEGKAYDGFMMMLPPFYAGFLMLLLMSLPI